MNQLYADLGGRPRKNDDILLLQDETKKTASSLLKGRGAMILNGITVSGSGPYNISTGLVYIDNEIMEFDGATSITFPYYIYQATPTLTNSLPYKTGGSKPTRQLIKATSGSSIPSSGEYITMSAAGGRTWFDAVNNQFVQLTGSQTISGVKTFTAGNSFTGSNSFTNTNTFSSTTVLNGPVTGSGSINITGNITSPVHISTVSTGTAPFTVSSTTKVTNLNADYLDGNDSSFFATATGLSSEITNRTNADTTLQNNINSEASTRSTNDSTLQTNINNEASTRSTNDSTLQTNINNEASARAAADTAIKNTSITGTGALTGGGDLNANRTMNVASFGISNGYIATDAVDGRVIAASSVGSSELAQLAQVLSVGSTITLTVNGSTEPTITAASLPNCKIGFWASFSWNNSYPNTGVLSYRINGVGIDGYNVLRMLQGHYHSGSGSSISTSTSFEHSWFCPLPPGGTGVFSMGHYVGSGVSATITIHAYV